MCRLVRAIAGHTYHIFGNLMSQLICLVRDYDVEVDSVFNSKYLLKSKCIRDAMPIYCLFNIFTQNLRFLYMYRFAPLLECWLFIFFVSYFIFSHFFIFLWSVKHHIKDVPWFNRAIRRPLRFRWIYDLLAISKVLPTRAAGDICTCSANEP